MSGHVSRLRLCHFRHKMRAWLTFQASAQSRCPRNRSLGVPTEFPSPARFAVVEIPKYIVAVSCPAHGLCHWRNLASPHHRRRVFRAWAAPEPGGLVVDNLVVADVAASAHRVGPIFFCTVCVGNRPVSGSAATGQRASSMFARNKHPGTSGNRMPMLCGAGVDCGVFTETSTDLRQSEETWQTS